MADMSIFQGASHITVNGDVSSNTTSGHYINKSRQNITNNYGSQNVSQTDYVNSNNDYSSHHHHTSYGAQTTVNNVNSNNATQTSYVNSNNDHSNTMYGDWRGYPQYPQQQGPPQGWPPQGQGQDYTNSYRNYPGMAQWYDPRAEGYLSGREQLDPSHLRGPYHAGNYQQRHQKRRNCPPNGFEPGQNQRHSCNSQEAHAMPRKNINVFANAYDFLPGELKVVETDRSVWNIQPGVSVSHNNIYHPGSHHSNPTFFGASNPLCQSLPWARGYGSGNSDGDDNPGPVPDTARPQRPYHSRVRRTYETQAHACAASPLEDSTCSNGAPVRAQRQDTYLGTLPQSPGFPPRASARQSMVEGTTTGSGSDREEELQPRSFQCRGGGRGARLGRLGPPPPPPPPPPPRPSLRPLHSCVGGGYTTQQQHSYHGQHQLDPQGQDPQYDSRYSEYRDPQYEDPQYQDSQCAQYPRYQQHPRRQQYPQQYPDDQEQAYCLPSPNSYTDNIPPSLFTHAPPLPTQAQPSSRSESTNSYYRRQGDSDSNESLPRARKQDTTYFGTPPQSPAFPPEQFEYVNGARRSPQQPMRGFRRERTTRMRVIGRLGPSRKKRNPLPPMYQRPSQHYRANKITHIQHQL